MPGFVDDRIAGAFFIDTPLIVIASKLLALWGWVFDCTAMVRRDAGVQRN